MLIFNKKAISKFILVFFITLCFLILAPSIFATNGTCQPGGCMKNVSRECACQGNCELNDILRIAVAWAKGIVGATAVFALIFFIVGGLMWLLSGGNPEQVKKGKQILIQTLIALLIVFFAWQIVNVVICAISKGSLEEPCTIFGKKWYVFPGEIEKKECLINPDGSPEETWEEGCHHEIIKRVKKLLNLLKCDCGEENEYYNAQMTSCVKKFQKANQLSETGKIDLATWKKIISQPGQPLPNNCQD